MPLGNRRFFPHLQGLQYRIHYRKGTKNGAANTMSRHSHLAQLLAISSVKHQWLNEVVSSYQSDPVAVDLLARLAVSADSVPPFSLSQGIIRHKNRV